MWEQFGKASACPSSLTGHFFQNFEFSITFLNHFHVLLLILVTVWSILVIFKGSGKSKKTKMEDPKWPLFENLM